MIGPHVQPTGSVPSCSRANALAYMAVPRSRRRRTGAVAHRTTRRPVRAVIELRDVGKTFAGVTARTVLSGISLDVAQGEFVAILGDSGVGKSTLLNLIAGLEQADSGTVSVDGRALGTLDDDALTAFRRNRIGFVFQAFHVLPYLTVAQNVALPLVLQGQRGPHADRRIAMMLAAVGLDDRAGSMPRELSGGEMQRVAIARALVHKPSLVLADEPTGNLDADSAAAVMDLFRACLVAENATALLVTHSHAAARRADRALLMSASGLAPVDVTAAAAAP
jgi:putative ABC transport system ATP-binding protein